MTRACTTLALALTLATPAHSQVAPDHDWRTLHAKRARIHYPAHLEPLARRTAANLDTAWTQLSVVLTPPRRPLDVVLSDDVDFSNGSATPIPTNRIILYAAPPIEPGALRYTTDWNALVTTHELVHVFHLDRSRGLWGLAQKVLGREPFLFPNAYGPSWLTEGIAVWFESELTGAGRLRGSEHRMIARAAALGHGVPRLDELSLATPRFPGGQAAYAYGSLFVEFLARERGAGAIRDFVERQSAQLVPLWIGHPAAGAFGDPLQRAWRRWSDSLVAAAGADRPPMPGWRALDAGQVSAGPPRWTGDTILQASSSGRDPLALHALATTGARREGTRRWETSPQVPLADGGVLYSQLDYVDPYRLRSDLWVERAGDRRRITTGARLSHPDARADGGIVAVQGVPGGSRLARVSADGRMVRAITGGGADTNWTEPRWSPDGLRIAAVRWLRGGTTEVVVLDAEGDAPRVLARARAVLSSPSWSPDGGQLWYSSDESGAANVRVVDLRTGAVRVASDAATGLLHPALSPDGRSLAALHFRADGWELGVAPVGDAGALAVVPPARAEVAPSSPAPVDATARATRYSPWRSALPRWWLPLLERDLDAGTRVGALTGGEDVVGRHAWSAELLAPATDDAGWRGNLSYRYAGLGRPLLDLWASHDESPRGALRTAEGQVVGQLRRRLQEAQLAAVFVRPRVRQSASLTLAVGVEERRYRTEPPELIDRLTQRPEDVVRPHTLVSAGWSRVDRAPWAVSVEQGVALSGTAVRRWNQGLTGAASHTLLGSAAGYLPLDLPGFARHVLAARVAVGATDRRATSALDVGGASGGSLVLLPGYTVGSGRETFGVRGFESAALVGLRAAAGTLEYRAPLRLSGRGLGLLPVFLDRTALALFGEMGAAWCPVDVARRRLCEYTGGDSLPPEGTRDSDVWRAIGSVGAELHVNAAVLSWDQPYRFRVGVAMPVRGREYSGAPRVSGYLAVGLAY